MASCRDIETEQAWLADLGAGEPAGPLAVLEDDQLHCSAETQRDDGEVEAAGSHRWDGEECTDRRCEYDAEENGEREREVPDVRSASGEEGTHACKCELSE